MFFGETGDCQRVRDTAASTDFFRRPMTARRLEDDGTRRIGDQEAVVVSKAAVLVSAATALSMRLDQIDHDANGRLCIVRPLESQTQDVHTRKSRLGIRFASKDSLVSDHESVLISP